MCAKERLTGEKRRENGILFSPSRVYIVWIKGGERTEPT
jgi:hypothetical protein